MSSALLFVALSLASFRVWRFIARDTWPPIEWLRDKIDGDSYFGELLICPWCLGTLLTALAFFIADTTTPVSVALPPLQAMAGAGVVGLLGALDDKLSE